MRVDVSTEAIIHLMLASVSAMPPSHDGGTSRLRLLQDLGLTLSRSFALVLRSLQLPLPRSIDQRFQTRRRAHERLGAAISLLIVYKKTAQRIATLVGFHQGKKVKVK